MAAKNKGGLGKGLDALFMDNSIEEEAKSAVKLKINDIEPNRAQPRKSFDEEALEELANSISTHGVIQPLLVRPLADGGYQLIAGERRWRASRMAGLTEVPVVIREMSDSEAMELALVENLQREDLNPVEEAMGYRSLMVSYGLTQEQVAERMGKSRSAVANALRILDLTPNETEALKAGKISAGHARALLGAEKGSTLRSDMLRVALAGASVRELELMLKKKKEAKKTEKTVDTYYTEVELAIKNELGRTVKITPKGKGKGTLTVEFYSKKELEDFAKRLTD